MFTIIFACESAAKMIAFNPKVYFSDGWNRFDFVIVAVSIPDLFMDTVGATVFRIFRIGRMFKLVQSARLC